MDYDREGGTTVTTSAQLKYMELMEDGETSEWMMEVRSRDKVGGGRRHFLSTSSGSSRPRGLEGASSGFSVIP
jgi:hypothetical protein